MMGDGHIDFPAITRAVLATGYQGDIEVEIFNQDVWDADPAEIARRTVRAFDACVAPSVPAQEPVPGAGRLERWVREEACAISPLLHAESEVRDPRFASPDIR
jgi:hypothetical protein